MSKLIKPFAKAVSWRVFSTVDTVVVAYVFVGDLSALGSMLGLSVITHTVLFMIHEQFWTIRPLARWMGEQRNSH